MFRTLLAKLLNIKKYLEKDAFFTRYKFKTTVREVVY